MGSFSDMTFNGTKVLQATGIDDPGRVSGAGTRRPDPEVPERARRRTFTAKYKLEFLAAYDGWCADEVMTYWWLDETR
jgi:hypothetical protein